MRLSDVEVDGAFLWDGRLGVVVSRYVGVGGGGVTDVGWDGGGAESFVWSERDVDVAYVGPGRLVQVVVLAAGTVASLVRIPRNEQERATMIASSKAAVLGGVQHAGEAAAGADVAGTARTDDPGSAQSPR
jgi:hypothetical protein